LAADRPLFTGLVEHSLDDKGRLVVPARFRERLGSGFFVSIGDPDPCLLLYPASIWYEFCARVEAAQVKDTRYRTSVRELFALTEEVSCDSQGRLVLPPALRTWAHIQKDVTSIGTLTRIEVWAKEQFAATPPTAGDLADFRAELGLY
jgi:MraZ protein